MTPTRRSSQDSSGRTRCAWEKWRNLSPGELHCLFFLFKVAQNLFRYAKANASFLSVRYLQKPGRSVPNQRGPLLTQMTSWLAEARHERLQKLLETLRATQLNSLAKKLEKTLSDIQQRNPGCSLIWHRSAILDILPTWIYYWTVILIFRMLKLHVNVLNWVMSSFFNIITIVPGVNLKY